MHQWFPDRVRARARSRSGARPVASNLLRRAMASLIGSVKLLISSAKPAIGGARRRDGEIRMGHGLWVHCDNRECLHRARIDLEAIAERYGAELSVAEFVNKSVCSGVRCALAQHLDLAGAGRHARCEDGLHREPGIDARPIRSCRHPLAREGEGPLSVGEGVGAGAWRNLVLRVCAGGQALSAPDRP